MTVQVEKLPDHQFKCLWALFPDDNDLIKIAATDERRKHWKKRPKTTGTLKGRRVYLDDKGVMATGYICYESGGVVYETGVYDEAVWDKTAEQEQWEDINDKLKKLGD